MHLTTDFYRSYVTDKPVHDHTDHLQHEHKHKEQEEDEAERLSGHLGTGHSERDGIQVVVLVQHEAQQHPQEVDEPVGHRGTRA
jgi:hypothetical protein